MKSIFQMSLYACIKSSNLTRFCFFVFPQSFLRIALVENIPEGLNYSENAPFHLPLFQGWMNLLNMAKKSVDIVSSHWDLNHSHPSACQVSCILCVCVMILLSALYSLWYCLHSSSSVSLSTFPHSPRASSHLYVRAIVHHITQVLLEHQAHKGNLRFICAPSKLCSLTSSYLLGTPHNSALHTCMFVVLAPYCLPEHLHPGPAPGAVCICRPERQGLACLEIKWSHVGWETDLVNSPPHLLALGLAGGQHQHLEGAGWPWWGRVCPQKDGERAPLPPAHWWPSDSCESHAPGPPGGTRPGLWSSESECAHRTGRQEPPCSTSHLHPHSSQPHSSSHSRRTAVGLVYHMSWTFIDYIYSTCSQPSSPVPMPVGT